MSTLVGVMAAAALVAGAVGGPQRGSYPNLSAAEDAFPLVRGGQPAPIWIDPAAPLGVRRVAEWFADDLRRATGARPPIFETADAPEGDSVLVGVLGSGGVVDRLAESGTIDTRGVAGRWESSLTQGIDAPGGGRLLVVAGADKRGAVYGLLDLSRSIGVSPWSWWADVPTERRTDVGVSVSRHVRGSPGVRYRGIFLNDEAPALANWASERFGGCNHRFYERVFELLLRLRGNYLWPAMWGRSLFDDDPRSQSLADELGIVLATSHHEPMQRAHVEWARYGRGPWDYTQNADALRAFWRAGVRRMNGFESIVTVGMRGDGDEPMSPEADVALLQRIVADQRAILAEELGAEAAARQPQVWALYKEVQEYYDRGMRAPDDVTLLLCDDNWGNVRRLPRPTDPPHPGGYGLYYHFDYVGDPRNYKWLDTNAPPRVWEQLWMAWEHGVDRVWIVNVGDLKPMEASIDFFLSMAWNPAAYPPERSDEAIAAWREAWAAEQLGMADAGAWADVIRRYAKLAARRKPELLDADTYSLAAYGEWDRVVGQWRSLARDAEELTERSPQPRASAIRQLVLHPVLAMANLHELYYAVARNRRSAAAGDPEANFYADAAEAAFARDAELTGVYHAVEGGKWNHMMSQTHIGYSSWQQPELQVMPRVERVSASVLKKPNTPRSLGLEEDVAPTADQPAAVSWDPAACGFAEEHGYVSVEAASFSANRGDPSAGVRWLVLGDHGRTGDAVASFPTTASPSEPGFGPFLEYPIWLAEDGEISVDAYLSPTQDLYGGDDHGLRFAISLDDGGPVVVDMHADRSTNERNFGPWRDRVAKAIHMMTTRPVRTTRGNHTLRFWRIDGGVVLQKLVVRRAELPQSYLGPPQSRRAEELR